MNIIDIIESKKHGNKLDKEEIDYFVKGYTEGNIPDYQISSLLMAIRLKGMDLEETTFLTSAMINSGDVLRYNTDKIIIDKHSTGGVGDKTSLVLVPLFATLGFGVSKMSGRGLGFTGGTIDKLESIKGFNVDLSEKKIIEQVKKIGCVIVSQNEKLVPADKKLYALRDVTATVDSPSLIASSIVSKKIALGAEVIVLDVKYGSGGFMKTKEEAIHLAKLMIEISKNLGKNPIAFITSMDQPLGKNIGNVLEVEEAIDTLSGKGNKELLDLCVNIASEVLVLQKHCSYQEASTIVKDKINSGKVLQKFKEMLEEQGAEEVEKLNLEQAKYSLDIKSEKDGYVKLISADEVGMAAMELGAGRKTKEDKIDLTVGIELLKKVGDEVKVGDTITRIHYNDKVKLEACLQILKRSYEFSENKVEKIKIIDEVIK